VWAEEVRRFGSGAHQIVRSVERKVDQQSLAEVVKGGGMQRSQGRSAELGRRQRPGRAQRGFSQRG
jgi:hypothetical protein